MKSWVGGILGMILTISAGLAVIVVFMMIIAVAHHLGVEEGLRRAAVDARLPTIQDPWEIPREHTDPR